MERPFVFINSAMSADGKISSTDRRQIRISGREDRARTDELRALSDAIMVGVGTVLADDPGLRVRSTSLCEKRKNMGRSELPLRVVVDSSARTPPDAKVLGPGCLVAVSHRAPEERLGRLRSACEIIRCGKEIVDLKGLMTELHRRGVERLMVEGGARLNWSMINLCLVDEMYVYIGGMVIGGDSAPTLVDGLGFQASFPRLRLQSVQRLDDGVLLNWIFDHNSPDADSNQTGGECRPG